MSIRWGGYCRQKLPKKERCNNINMEVAADGNLWDEVFGCPHASPFVLVVCWV